MHAAESALEEVEGVFAVRCQPAGQRRVHDELAKLGRVRVFTAQNLLIVELPAAKRREQAMEKLTGWQREGTVEFFTPVLQDKESQLLRILTDEITVRFKAAVPQRRRERVQRLFGVTVARQNEFVPDQYVVKVPQTTGLKSLKIAQKLDKVAEVEFAAPNYISEYRR